VHADLLLEQVMSGDLERATLSRAHRDAHSGRAWTTITGNNPALVRSPAFAAPFVDFVGRSLPVCAFLSGRTMARPFVVRTVPAPSSSAEG
jgi:hypothetical protein